MENVKRSVGFCQGFKGKKDEYDVAKETFRVMKLLYMTQK